MHVRPSLSQSPRVFSTAWPTGFTPTALGVRQDPLVIFAPGCDKRSLDPRSNVKDTSSRVNPFGFQSPWVGIKFWEVSHPRGCQLIYGEAPDHSHATLLLALGGGLSWANPTNASRSCPG